MTQELSVQFQRLPSNPDLPLPARATPQAAGYDIRSTTEVVLNPGEIRLISTGLIMELPEGMECQVRPRSGLALKYGITLANSPGTIDPDYRGEVKVILINHFSKIFTIKPNMRIGQIVFAPIVKIQLQLGDVNIFETKRSSKGFGSTGLK